MSADDRGSLFPLPDDHRRGLIVLTSFSFLSFFATSILWTFITYKLVSYRIHAPRQEKREHVEQTKKREEEEGTVDFSMGLRSDLFHDGKTVDIAMLDEMAKHASEAAGGGGPEKRDLEHGSEQRPRTPRFTRFSEKVNPFPILVYNLLLADMMEAIAYGMSIKWVVSDGIFAPSATCWAQGWFGSTSNLAASLFLSAISINSFLTIVLGYRMPRWGLYICILGIWAFVLLVNAAGVLQAESGHFRTPSGESYFMRANVWVRHQKSRKEEEHVGIWTWLTTGDCSAGSHPITTRGDSGHTMPGSSFPWPSASRSTLQYSVSSLYKNAIAATFQKRKFTRPIPPDSSPRGQHFRAIIRPFSPIHLFTYFASLLWSSVVLPSSWAKTWAYISSHSPGQSWQRTGCSTRFFGPQPSCLVLRKTSRPQVSTNSHFSERQLGIMDTR